jgi:hypothetical protein
VNALPGLSLPPSRPAKLRVEITLCAAGYPHAAILCDVGPVELEIARISGGIRYTLEDCVREVRETWSIEPTIRKR